MINLSDPKYKERLDTTPENILNFVSEYDIYRNYIGDFVIGRTFTSPLRDGGDQDDNPSFGIYWSKKYSNKLLFKDLAKGVKGDCFVFVSEKYGISYNNAILKVILDFRIQDYFKVPKVVKITPQKRPPKLIDKDNLPKPNENIIQVRIRDWQPHDIKFWNRFGITIDILRRYNVYPIDYIFLNTNIIKADKHSYAYHEQKDGIDRFKIYQPYSDKLKWLSNFIEGTLSGWTQMPNKGDKLIITSSLKDVMTLVRLGFHSISPQTETYTFKNHIINELNKRFNEIYIFYDYDKAGIQNAFKNHREYGFIPIFTKSTILKDPSDYFEKRGGGELHKRIELLSSKI
ncbi:MAG: toprim domain-containing protein [Candidatus Hodarchaeales archaeon]|jgi:hypothetical protein